MFKKKQSLPQQATHTMDLCSGPVLPLMLRFAVPLMFSGLLQLLFNAADIVVVGRFAGDDALAAVGSNSALINLLTNLFMGLSIGANVVAARDYGAGRDKDLHRTLHTSMLISLASGLILTVVGICGAKQILIWMKTPADVLPLAVIYLRIYFLGITGTMVYNFGSALLRAVGDTKRPFYYLTLAGVLNVLLNLFFVLVCRLGVAGVAIATAVSQTLAAWLVVRCMMEESGPVRLILKELRLDKKKFGQILKVGLPAGIQGVIFSLSNVVIQSSVNTFGDTVVAGNSAAANLEGFVYFAMTAFYQSTISFASQNYGAGQYKRIVKTVWAALLCVAVVGISIGGAVALWGETLLHIYSPSAPVIAAGAVRLEVICSLYVLCGMMEIFVGALRGIGYSITPMLVSLIGVCGVRLLWLATVFQMPQYHVATTIYWSYPVSWIIALLALALCFFLDYRTVSRRATRHAQLEAARSAHLDAELAKPPVPAEPEEMGSDDFGYIE